MPDSPPPPLPPPPVPSSSNSTSSQQQQPPMFNSLELDYLVYTYLKESGYSSTSNSLLSESNLQQPSNPTETESGGHHLVKLLHKGLLYSQAEHQYLHGTTKRIKLGDPIESTLHLPPLPKKKRLSTPPPQPEPILPLPLPQPIPTTQSKGKAKEKDQNAVNEKKRKSSSVQPSITSTTVSGHTSDQEPEGKRSRITSNDSANSNKSKNKVNGKSSKVNGSIKGKGKGKEKQIESDHSDDDDDDDEESEKEDEKEQQEEEDTRMKDLMPAPSLPIASTSKPSLPPPSSTSSSLPPPPLPAPISSTTESQSQPSKPRPILPSSNPSNLSSTSLPAPPPPYKRPQITTSLSSHSTPVPSNSTSNSKRSQSPIQSRKPVPAPPLPPPPPPPAPAPTSNGPAKIRITTTTRNVPTPQSSSSLPRQEGISPITSRAANGVGTEKKEEGGKKLMKVKNEESTNSALGKVGNGKGGGGKIELSKEELAAKQKRKKDREALREKEREKELVNAAKEREREREKEKERERERKEKERERESKVDLSRCKRIKSSDERVLKLRGHTVAMVQPCSFNSKVPTLLATGGGDSTCRIWDVPPSTTAPTKGEEEEHIVCKHASAQRKVGVAAVAWDPSGSLLATGSEDGIARIWTPSGDLHLVLSMHQRAINSLRWAPSGTLLLTGSLDSTVCLWELSSGKVRQQYGTHGDSILDVDWNDDSTFASASMDKTVHLFTTGRNNPIHRLKGHRDEVNVVKFSPCGTLVATCSDDHTVRIWSLRNLPALASTINSKSVKKGDENRKIDRDEEEEDGEDGNEKGCLVLKGHESEVHQISWKPGCGKAGTEGDGNRLIASCSFDHTAKLWDADEGTCLYTFSRHQDFVYSIAFEPTLGRFLATGSNDGTVMVWRIKDKALVLEYESPAPVYELTFNPPGTQIAVTGQLEQVAVVPFDGVAAFNS